MYIMTQFWKRKIAFCTRAEHTTTDYNVQEMGNSKYHMKLFFTSISKEKRIKEKPYLRDLLYARQDPKQSNL